MKYFVDFEATQFSNEIIEIGCVREDGVEFQSYVNADKKLTQFIINLTGITQDVVDNAPQSDEVFSDFYKWLQGDTDIVFYCYGNSDIDFVKKNLRKSKNFEAQAALSMIGMALNDYAVSVKNHFGIIKSIGLVKVLAHYRGVESIEQTHSAIEDARYLKEVFECIQAEGECSECPFPEYQKPKKVAKPVQPKVEVPSTPHIARIRKNQIVETYENMDAAVAWVYSQMANEHTADQLQGIKIENLAKRIRSASSMKKTYMNWKWKIYGGTPEVNNISENFVLPVVVKEENMEGETE